MPKKSASPVEPPKRRGFPKVVPLLEVEKELGICRATAKRLGKTGQLEMIRVGNAYRVTVRSLARLVNDQLKQRA